ncbi:GH36-type glycosyl hydrolase domain-containing protein [Ideonella sp.]|uniref:GH36-type glycosyl hydrolase domain-containing protein n=1 Tax=Ideonella sp. TaxID=1929293 RepID=UPI0037BEE15A
MSARPRDSVDVAALPPLLSALRHPLQAPLRAELFGPQRFGQHGRSLAMSHAVAPQPWRRASFAPALRSNVAALREAHNAMAEQARLGHDLSPATEWLLDNFHLIEAQVQAVHEGLPHRYFRALPKLSTAPLSGLPRIYGVAWAFVAHTDSAFDLQLLETFLLGYISQGTLTLAELWALPTTLRVVLIENLRRLAERVATQQAAVDLANLWADRAEPPPLSVLMQQKEALERRGVATVFLNQLAQRFSAEEPSALWASATLQSWLLQALPRPAASAAQQAAEQAADNLSVSNAVQSLRAIDDADWPGVVARVSPLMHRMLGHALFAAESTPTQDDSLHALERLARRSGRGELEVADALLQRLQAAAPDQPWQATAQHWLHGEGFNALAADLGLPRRGQWLQRARKLGSSAYIACVLGASAAAVMWAWPQAPLPLSLMILLAALMGITLSEAVQAVLNRLISESVRPKRLARLAWPEGVPAAHRVLVVIPALLSDAPTLRALLLRLQLHQLANPEPQAQFALLTDWPDAPQEHLPSDAGLWAELQAQLQALNKGVQPLPCLPGDALPPPRFVALHRPRVFSPGEQCWMGWERKRGKLEQLLRQLATGSGGDFSVPGPSGALASGITHVLTLDSDTELPPGRLRELLSVAAHPYNAPSLSAEGRHLRHGWSIFQPRLASPLAQGAQDTRYHRLMSDGGGLDPYSAASSDVYQDLFGEGSFNGKGLLQVQAVQALLGGRLPSNQVLSHDLLEGAIARCAVVSDLSVVEASPCHSDVAAERLSRWTRGDWQLLPFVLQAGRYGLSGLQVWKMVDNLRRSLLPPAVLLWWGLSLAGFGPGPLQVLAAAAAAFGAGPVMGALAGLVTRRSDVARRHFWHRGLMEVLRALGVTLWSLVTLPLAAWRALNAVGLALYRQCISRRHLLQWTTSASVAARQDHSLTGAWRRHGLLSAAALLAGGAAVVAGTPWPLWAAGSGLLWGLAPLMLWWINQPAQNPQAEAALQPDEAEALAQIARETWRYFERVVGPEDRHLPPDNLQTSPHEMLAHRTSPTNIGLYLLSAACARQWGWLGTEDLLDRLEATLATVQSLPHYRGHLMNWTATRSPQPLLPLYVSTVDSGNLAAHLLTVAQACLALAAEPYAAAPRLLAQQRAEREVRRCWPLRHHNGAARVQLCDALLDARRSRQSAQRDEHAAAQGLAPQAARRLHAVAAQAQAQAEAMDFGMLYHPQRRLFHIGLRVAEQALDPGFFDLLASEANLTSLLAVAQGQVPVQHWKALGRPFFAVGVRAGLRSWSGSMFEYLMPRLVLAAPPGSVLHDAALTALDEQRAFASHHRVPWGLSESAYAGRDHTLAYQYAPQGVPRLALRRTPPDDLVIAPYATALAAMLAPRLAWRNFVALQRWGARGRYGFIEALDFSLSQRHGGQACSLVQTYMAHHQGMTIVALSNVLLGEVVQGWGAAHRPWQAVASLLHERSPRAVSRLGPCAAVPPHRAASAHATGGLREVPPGATALAPTHLLSNGRYRVSLRPNGAGWSRWGSTGLSRWRDDALRDAYGHFLYLQRPHHPTPHSLTLHPAPDPGAIYRCHFHADRVSFEAEWPDLLVRTTVWVSPEDDIEFRQVEFKHLGDAPLTLTLMSAFEPTLSDDRADEDHPAFSNLFVQAHWQAQAQSLLFSRKPRLTEDPATHLVHFLADRDPAVTGLHYQTRRLDWRGRQRDVSQPLALLQPVPLKDTELNTGLDPVCVLAATLTLAAGSTARLTWATAASTDVGVLWAVVDKYSQGLQVQRASLMSSTLAASRLQAQGLSGEALLALQTLSTAMLLSLTRADSHGPRPSRVADRRDLWRFGLSGERPLLLVSVATAAGMGLLRTLAQGLRLWAWGGVACDLVVRCTGPSSYHQAVQHEVAGLVDSYRAEEPEAHPQRPGFFWLRGEDLSAAEWDSLRSLARLHLHADGRPLAHHLLLRLDRHEHALATRRSQGHVVLPQGPGAGPACVPAVGRFAADGSGEFTFEVSAQQRPQRPWINVLANPRFGAQCSEAGGGYTWAGNSRLQQLTAWSNDPISDPASEWWWLQDEDSQAQWPLAAAAGCEPNLLYQVTHGQGYTRISHQRGTLSVSATWCVDAEACVKQVQVRLHHAGPQTLHLRLVGVAEWLMGAHRRDRNTVSTALFKQRLEGHGRTLTALLCSQNDHAAGFGGQTAYLALVGEADEDADWTCDRRELFDAQGRRVLPQHFGQRSGEGLDPCAALSLSVRLRPGQTVERTFLLGHSGSAEGARGQALQAALVAPSERLALSRHHWDQRLQALEVTTPDPLFDALVNRWLLYQTVVCRLWSKAGFYQAGGATGFRDQLQDAMALAWAEPALLRRQLLRCAGRQFAEGDVQHWWHWPSGAGVRTHCSDDRLWLPLACAHYLRCTAELAVLEETRPFLVAPALAAGAEDAYTTPQLGAEATLYEHAALAIDASLAVGEHGLPLMGGGDWNDGMNRVGAEGRGESVWLGFFLCHVVEQFAPIARARQDLARAEAWQAAAAGRRQALAGPAWDGRWFRRAFFDDGSTLGSNADAESRIDLVAQAWSVLSQAAPAPMQGLALEAMLSRLAEPDYGLLRLLAPPRQSALPSPGYVQAYPPGVRENGGQYNHAAVWALMALAEAQQHAATQRAQGAEEVWQLFTWLSPAHRSAHPLRGPAYGLEPYVMAGDICSQAPYLGQGGWSWYTGSAAWMHRAAVESLLGLHWSAHSLHLQPCLPKHWPQAEVVLRRDGRTMTFTLLRVTPEQASAECLRRQAHRLEVGERLAWPDLPTQSHFLVPLLLHSVG